MITPTRIPANGRPRPQTPRRLGDRLVVEFATAPDVAAGIARVAALLRRSTSVDRVEWWAPAENGASLRLTVVEGEGDGTRTAVPLGAAGALVLVAPGEHPTPTAAIVPLVRLVRRRWTDERLAAHATLLVRRVEALEDFAALVAHELKAPLQAGLLAGDAAGGAQAALELADSVLEAVKSERAAEHRAAPRLCLRRALDDLGSIDVEVVDALPDTFPFPTEALRLVLRNLVANAYAAGARRIHLSVTGRTLVVDDDGAGIEAPASYAAGSRLGLALCTRLARRLGASLELWPRPDGGTRAALVVGAEP